MSELPEGYEKGLARVSSIVEFCFPFEGTSDETRYLDWLADNVPDDRKRGFAINPEEYVNKACDWGTLVHNALEDYINDSGLDKRVYDKLIEEGIVDEFTWGQEWLDELESEEIRTEVYVKEKNKLFQGAVDLLYKKDSKWILADWKTYGIAKKHWDIHITDEEHKMYGKISPIAKKKRDKVKLQMSIYAYALSQQGIEIDKIELLYLHENGLKIVEMDRYEDVEIEKIIKDYNESLIPKNNKMTIDELQGLESFDLPMEIEILEATSQFSNIKVRLNLETIDNGKTNKQNVDQLIRKAKYIKSKLI